MVVASRLGHCDDLLHRDLVFPAIAEVVFIDEGTAALDEILESILALVLEVEITRVVDVGHPVVLVADFELVKMGVGPAHRHLDREVDIFERPRTRHLDRAPDRRLDLLQPDVQLE